MKDNKELLLEELTVVKRSGQRVIFNSNKIAIAIKKGFDHSNNKYTEKDINKVYESVLKYINENYVGRKTINVEDIQDIIETKLKDNKYLDVYNVFSDYRLLRAESRKAFGVKQLHKFNKAIERITNDKNCFDKTSNEVLLDFGKTIACEYTKSYVLDNKFVRAHDEGNIYIHNLDYFNLGKLSYTHLIFDDVVENDFPSGFIVKALEAKSEIDGEIAIDAIDELLEKLIIKEFKNIYKKTLNNYLTITGHLEYINIKKLYEVIDKETSINFSEEVFNAIILNNQMKYLFDRVYKDSVSVLTNQLTNSFKKILELLNNNHEENKKYSISLGGTNTYEKLLIDKCYLEVLKEMPYLNNITTIYKIRKTNDKEMLDIVGNLVLDGKNICFSFVDSSYNSDPVSCVEYFGNGKRIFENTLYDENVSTGRMVISSVTVNLGRLGLKYKGKSKEDFYKELDELLDLTKNCLINIFETIGDKSTKNYQILFKGNILDDDRLEEGQKIRKIIKKGVLNISLSGLLECVKCLESNPLNEEKLICEIIKHVNLKSKNYTEEAKLNFVVSETSKRRPLKKLMELDKAIYGINKDITDKDSYERIDSLLSNSKTIKDNMKFVGKYQKLLNGGCLTKVELAKNTSLKRVLEYIDEAINMDVGFLKLEINGRCKNEN